MVTDDSSTSGLFRLVSLDESKLDEFTRHRRERAFPQLARRIVEVFESIHGRPAESVDEIANWLNSGATAAPRRIEGRDAAAAEIGRLTLRLDGCIGTVAMAADVVFYARGGESEKLEDAWPALDLVKAELERIRNKLSEVDDALQKRTN